MCLNLSVRVGKFRPVNLLVQMMCGMIPDIKKQHIKYPSRKVAGVVVGTRNLTFRVLQIIGCHQKVNSNQLRNKDEQKGFFPADVQRHRPKKKQQSVLYQYFAKLGGTK